jgi:hypothetical protein
MGETVKSVYVECCAPQDDSARVFYRWRCRECVLFGEWQRWLSDAEIEGEQHRREDHGEGMACA